MRKKKIFFISSIASHLASLRGLRQLENGQLNLILCFLFFLCFFLSSNEELPGSGFASDEMLHTFANSHKMIGYILY